jgi:hypothetical protein
MCCTGSTASNLSLLTTTATAPDQVTRQCAATAATAVLATALATVSVQGIAVVYALTVPVARATCSSTCTMSMPATAP